MKTVIRHHFLLLTLLVGLGLIPADRVAGQIFTSLHTFNFESDGGYPDGMVLSDNTLYGVAAYGGASGKGTVFRMNTHGTGFTNLHSFAATSGFPATNSEGSVPYGVLVLSGNTLYGTASAGGTAGRGGVFRLDTDGAGFASLHSFTATLSGTNSDGTTPYGGLVLAGNTLYGTASAGGSSSNGTVFAVSTDGTGFTNLHSFTPTSRFYPYGNSDGAAPVAGLMLSGDTLYGTAYGGGSSGNGTVFAINTNGAGFTNLHSFTETSEGRNSDGAYPRGSLILSGNTLYGTASRGGSLAGGTVYAVSTDGTGFTTIHSLSYGADGAEPHAGLALSGKALYGTARGGGSSGWGSLFKVNTNGAEFINLTGLGHIDFGSQIVQIIQPHAGLILSRNTLYGTSSGQAGVFSISFAPQLTILQCETNVVIAWPTNAAGFDYAGFILQSTTNLISPEAWSDVFPGPAIVNGHNTVTNPVSGVRKFYRLSQ